MIGSPTPSVVEARSPEWLAGYRAALAPPIDPMIAEAAAEWVVLEQAHEATCIVEGYRFVVGGKPSDACSNLAHDADAARIRLETRMRGAGVRWVAAVGTLIFDESPEDEFPEPLRTVPIAPDPPPGPFAMPPADPTIVRLAEAYVAADLRWDAQMEAEAGQLQESHGRAILEVMRNTRVGLGNALACLMVDRGVWWTPAGAWLLCLVANLNFIDPGPGLHAIHYVPLLAGPDRRIERSADSRRGEVSG